MTEAAGDGFVKHILQAWMDEDGTLWDVYKPSIDRKGPDGITYASHEIEFRDPDVNSHHWADVGGDPAWLSCLEYRYKTRQDAQETQEDLFGYPTTLDATIGNPEPSVDDLRQVSLPDGDADRLDYPMFDGLIAYFPNALAEISRLSKIGNEQHNPGQPMHWARDKSTDHGNKIIRHQVDAGKLDSKGNRHSTSVAWRALAQLQEELERDLGLPPSPASRNRPW